MGKVHEHLFGRRKTRSTNEIIDRITGITGSTEMTRQRALEIPTVAGCVKLLSEVVAGIPIKLYEERDGAVYELKEDKRIRLLNEESGDLLDAFSLKREMVKDYLLDGNGYCYIQRSGNKIESLHYVPAAEVSVSYNVDPIFKDGFYLISGKTYRDFELLALVQNTKKGLSGKGIVAENPLILSVAHSFLKYERVLAASGGNKKGFLKAQSRLESGAIERLKTAWKRLYSNENENILILNDGIDFKEISSTSVEMQLNESKKRNSEEICKLFNMPPSVLDGDYKSEGKGIDTRMMKNAVMPILKAFTSALNRFLLLESEKETRYFAFDTKDLLKADIKERYEAYQIALNSGFMQTDEIRYEEDLPPLNLNFVKLGLNDVLYYPQTDEVYTPNTDRRISLKDKPKGGEKE